MYHAKLLMCNWKKVLALLLASALLLSTLSMTLPSEAGVVGQGSIATFDTLSSGIKEQTVPTGTAQEDLKLPDTLGATDEDGIPVTVKGMMWECNAPATGYDTDTTGEYTFAPKIPTTYAVNAGVDTPVITVTVKAIENEEGSFGDPVTPTATPEPTEEPAPTPTSSDETTPPPTPMVNTDKTVITTFTKLEDTILWPGYNYGEIASRDDLNLPGALPECITLSEISVFIQPTEGVKIAPISYPGNGSITITTFTTGALQTAIDNALTNDGGTAPYVASDYSKITSLSFDASAGTLDTADTVFLRSNLIGLKELDISGITGAFPSNAFDNYTSLETVKLPAGVAISDNMFSGCTSLTSVDLSAVTAIGSEAFYGCSSLSDVIWWTSTPTLYDGNIFGGCAIDFSFYRFPTYRKPFPESSLTTYAPNQTPRVNFFSYDNSYSIYQGQPFDASDYYQLQSDYVLPFINLTRDDYSWLSNSFSQNSPNTFPTVTLSGFYDVNTPGIYALMLTLPGTVLADNHALELTLTVLPNMTVSGSGDQTVADGDTARFTVTVNDGHEPFLYVWREYATLAVANADTDGTSADGTTLSNGGAYGGTATNTLTVTASSALSGKYYKCFVAEDYGVESAGNEQEASSAAARLTLTVVPPDSPLYTIAVSANPINGGSVTGSSNDITENTSHTITATANTNYHFVNWTEGGTVVSTSASYGFTVTGNRTLVANFEYADPGSSPTIYTINVSASPTDGGLVTGGGNITENTNHTVTAAANADYHFTGWAEDGVVVSTRANYSFTVTDNRTLVAKFEYTDTAVFYSTKASAGLNGKTTFKTVTGLPQTGDDSNIWLWVITGLLSILGGLCTLVWRKWRDEKMLK